MLFPLAVSDAEREPDTPLSRIVDQVLKIPTTVFITISRVNPAFLFAVMLWYPLCEHAEKSRPG